MVDVATKTPWEITFDPAKRQRTLLERGLDFADAVQVFETGVFEVEDTRRPYGETRVICYGFLDDRLLVVVYAPRKRRRHVISMRKANEREKARFGN